MPTGHGLGDVVVPKVIALGANKRRGLSPRVPRRSGSALLVVAFFSVWTRGLARSLRMGDKLLRLLRICFLQRKGCGVEAACTATLLGCTSARTLLSMSAAEMAGSVAKAMAEQDWVAMKRAVLRYTALGVPAALVNAGIKHLTRVQALLFQRRLAQAVNQTYVRGSNFFKASSLPRCKIDQVDQRVTADVERFAGEVATLLTTVTKPLLDVVLLTMKLGCQLGVHAPASVIAVSLSVSQLKTAVLPVVKRLAQVESALAGDYRSAHGRLRASAEEIALFRGAERERALLDSTMGRLFAASLGLSRAQWVLGIVDHYLIKYASPVLAWTLQAFELKRQSSSMGDVVSDFVRVGSQLVDLGGAVGHLVQATTRVASLAGITSRVSEVFEAVERLEAAGNEPFVVVRAQAPTAEFAGASAPANAPRPRSERLDTGWLQDWPRARRLDVHSDDRRARESQIVSTLEGGQMRRVESFARVPSVNDASKLLDVGGAIQFDHVDVASPDGQLLVRDLTFCVPHGCNVLVTGPNGSGKSAIVRVLGDLWPLAAGSIIKPPLGEVRPAPSYGCSGRTGTHGRRRRGRGRLSSYPSVRTSWPARSGTSSSTRSKPTLPPTSAGGGASPWAGRTSLRPRAPASGAGPWTRSSGGSCALWTPLTPSSPSSPCLRTATGRRRSLAARSSALPWPGCSSSSPSTPSSTSAHPPYLRRWKVVFTRPAASWASPSSPCPTSSCS